MCNFKMFGHKKWSKQQPLDNSNDLELSISADTWLQRMKYNEYNKM